MPHLQRARLAFALTAVFAAAACGAGIVKTGDTCTKIGSTEECRSGAICGQDNGVTMCLTICSDDSDCSATERCSGVSNTNTKACVMHDGTVARNLTVEQQRWSSVIRTPFPAGGGVSGIF